MNTCLRSLLYIFFDSLTIIACNLLLRMHFSLLRCRVFLYNVQTVCLNREIIILLSVFWSLLRIFFNMIVINFLFYWPDFIGGIIILDLLNINLRTILKLWPIKKWWFLLFLSIFFNYLFWRATTLVHTSYLIELFLINRFEWFNVFF